MPVLTRSAARQLPDQTIDTSSFALRESVATKIDVTWAYRDHIDIYTKKRRTETENAQNDHVLELQLAEMAFTRAFSKERGNAHSMATIQTTALLRSVLNGTDNLNVTSRKINQAKKGPFSAGINRLQKNDFRTIHIQQLVRQGRGKWMIDDGTWANIETSVVKSYDEISCKLYDVDAIHAASRLVDATMDELNQLVCSLGLM